MRKAKSSVPAVATPVVDEAASAKKKANAERQDRWRNSNKELGLVRVEVWVPEARRVEVLKLEAKLHAEIGVFRNRVKSSRAKPAEKVEGVRAAKVARKTAASASSRAAAGTVVKKSAHR